MKRSMINYPHTGECISGVPPARRRTCTARLPEYRYAGHVAGSFRRQGLWQRTTGKSLKTSGIRIQLTALVSWLFVCSATVYSQDKPDTEDRRLVFSTSVVNALISNPVEPVEVVYKKIDTVTLTLRFYRPAGFKPSQQYPTIIFFFGGGWTGGSMKQFQYHAKYFAARGMIAVLADYRVASRNKTTPFEAVEDARSAIRFLRVNSNRYGIDKNRIVASGGSAGGHLAAAADLTRLDDPADDRRVSARPDALVLFNPVIDNGPGGYGFDRVKARYKEFSPLHNIQAKAAPTIMFLGTKDRFVPVATAELYRDKMLEKGNRCELFLYKDQLHGFFNYKKEGDSRFFVETITQADIFLTSLGYLKGEPSESITQDERMQWWRNARFGMFIHWGLYAVPAGEWNGKPVEGIGEWIMKRAKIPVKDYRQLAGRFNPVKFNAQEFVATAKKAGMKYITITSKHHDGFAMFKSAASKYNIVDATPYGKDVIKALAEECGKEDMKLCFYYSQSRDWNEPDGLDNTWDFPETRNFQKYLDEKVKPQLKELLTNYGQIGLIWFDTPMTISEAQAQSLKDLVRSLQPGCIISGRLGGGVETDYMSTGDNVVPSMVVAGDWEVPATLNNTWGFKKNDHEWKSPEALTRLLFDIAAKGGNYLLNVGPDAEGVIPKESVNILAKVGSWMKVNSESIYGTKGNPFNIEFKWGSITQKPGKLYLGIFDWPAKDFYLEGLRNKIKRIYLLSDTTRKPLVFQVVSDAKTGHHRLKIELPERAPDPVVSVVVVEIEGKPDIEAGIWQQADRSIVLPGLLATPRKDDKPVRLEFTARGGGADWRDPGIGLTWIFNVEKPGTYGIDIVSTETGSHGSPVWKGGQKIKINCDGQEKQIVISDQRREYNPRSLYWKLIHSSGGEIRFDKPGTYRLSLIPQSFAEEKIGFTFKEINLRPVDNEGISNK